jgi:outer membrane protein OmpA-like peptidoglycan-associated protein
MRIKNRPVGFCLLLVLLLLNACTAPARQVPIPDNSPVAVGVATGAVGGAVLGSFGGLSLPFAATLGGVIGGAVGMAIADAELTPLLSQLSRHHVQVVQIGEDIMILLPAAFYFYPDSTHINEAFYPGLDNVAAFIRQFPTAEIKVAGYTHGLGNPARNLALSRQQAQNIAHYLWRAGLDTRMMYAIGYGSEYPIASNEDEHGRLANCRVQITFRRIPPDTIN